jgi:hypothetical protein
LIASFANQWGFRLVSMTMMLMYAIQPLSAILEASMFLVSKTQGVRICEPDFSPDERLRLLSLLARQYSIRGQIIELRNKSLHYVQKDPDRATAITARLGQWWNDIEDLQDAEEDQYASIYHVTVLTVLKHEAIISLNRPALAASRQGPAYDAALQCCISSARAIITTLHKAIKPCGGPQKDAPLSLLWPSFTWAVWISTFVLFHAASSNHISQGVVSRYLFVACWYFKSLMFVARLADKALDILQHLSRRGSVWPDASAAAVRDLRARITHRQSKAATIPRSLQSPNNIGVGDNCPPETDASEALNVGNSTDPAHPANSSREHPTSSTGVTFEQAAPGPQPASLSINPPSARESDGPENQMYTNASAVPVNNPPNDFAGFNLGTTEWNTFMQASENDGLGPTLSAGDTMDPYAGFDIPFWLGQDQYWDIINERN